MKKFLMLTACLLLSLVLVACGAKTEDPNGQLIEFDKSNAKTQVLTVWLDDSEEKFSSEVIAAFEEANPGITVEFQHMATTDAREKLKTYGQSGFGADVFQFPHDHMAQAILDDLVYVLPDEVLNRLQDRILPVALDIATTSYDASTGEFGTGEDKLFSVPISIESVVIYYNKDLVTKVPETFEELLEQSIAWKTSSAATSETGVGNYGLATSSHWADGYFIQGIYGAFGWNPFGPKLDDATEVGFEAQACQDAISWMVNSLKPAVTGNGNHDSVSTAVALFQEGKIPFLLSGPWQINDFKSAGINYGAFTLPTINGKECKTFAGAQMVAVYKYSKNIDAAVKFVEFLASDEAASILYSTSGDCPALKTDILDTIDGLKEDEAMQVMLDQLETSVPMPTIPQVTYYWGPQETMMKNIWNTAASIAEQVKTAEASYKANRDMAS